MTTDLTTLAAELSAAKADHAQWERLTSAAARVKALVATFDKAKAATAKAEAAEAKAASEARFAGLSNIRVTETPASGLDSGGVLRSIFTITWTGSVYDMYSGTSVPTEQSRNDFKQLPANVLAFLIEKHPEQIPANIMAFAPGDPAGAIEEYIRAYARGYVKGKVSA